MSQSVAKPDRMLISRNLQRAMARQGVGLRELSNRVASLVKEREGEAPRGSSYGGIRAYVEGEVKAPRVATLRLIADALQVREEWLIWDEGEMTEAEERLAMAARDEMPPFDSDDWFPVRVALLFPEYELMPPDAKALAGTAMVQFMRASAVGIGEGDTDADTFNMFLMALRQAVIAPLMFWDAPIQWDDRRVHDFLRAQISAFLLTIPERLDRDPHHIFVSAKAREGEDAGSVYQVQLTDL